MNKEPIKKYRAGGVTVAVWENNGTGRDGQETEFQSVTLDRRYKNKAGQWESSHSFRANDIPKAVLALQKAYDFIVSPKAD